VNRYETLLIEEDGPVTWILLNRPEKLNAISDQLQGELIDALEALKSSGGKVIVLRGQGRCFSAGYDLAPDNEEALLESARIKKLSGKTREYQTILKKILQSFKQRYRNMET